MRTSLALIMLACGLHAQAPVLGDPAKPVPPPCNSYRMDETPLLSLHQRFCLWTRRSLFSGEGLSGAVIAAAQAQVTDKPSDLRKGFPGFAIRVSTRYAASTAKGTAETLVGYLNHEGMRRELGPWRPRSQLRRSFWSRSGGAIAAPFWNYDDDDARSKLRGKRFAVSRVAASFASGFAGMAWTPDRLNTPGNALKRSGIAYANYFVSSVFMEFKPDLAKLFKRVF